MCGDSVYCGFIVFFFFFQAEDGIRDLVRSRGLGDVYKRQFGDRVNVQPIFLPLGNDCVLTDGYFKTLRAHYALSLIHI